MNTHADSSKIEGLEPSLVWRLFAGMSAIPRCSKHEEQIRRHVLDLAQEKGFQAREDRAGNIVIKVPASKGCENAPITVLQGHLDMVCEKNAGTSHDFSRDPIRLIVDRDQAGEQIVRADGTTLGADNAIGLALGLAAACSPEVVHAPLELLCTVDEEAGMTGAKALEPDFIRGRRMLNLDSEEDDAICIGCAGGCDTLLTWEFDAQPLGSQVETCRVRVTGLRGGHSGSNIHENRGNAIKLLVRTLLGADTALLRLAAIGGGSKRNAIPREAEAVVCAPAGTRAALEKAANLVCRGAIRESAEPGLTITVEGASADQASAAIAVADTERLLETLAALPNGVLAMNTQIPDLVQTSTNLGIIRTEPAGSDGGLRIEVNCLSRSSSDVQIHATVRQITAVGRLAGAKVWSGNDYPGWEPNVDSPTLATCRRVYEKLFGQTPNVSAIHAGLECGLIGRRFSGMDMVAIGPRVEGGHSPDERVYVASVQKSWKYLVAILAELVRGQ